VVVSERAAPGIASLSGGSAGVPVADGWLFVVHDALQIGVHRRYSHRFLLLDSTFTLAGVSPPFHFSGAEVEYCCGAAPRGSELILSFGIEDRAAALAVMELDEVLDLLEPPTNRSR